MPAGRRARRGFCPHFRLAIPTAGFEPVKIGETEQSGRLEVGGGNLHDLIVGPAEARLLISAA